MNRNWLATTALLVVFYTNYFGLIDHYFLRDKKLIFYITNLLLVILIYLVGQKVLAYDAFNPIQMGTRLREIRTGSNSSLQLILPLILGIGMSVGLKINKERLKSELALQNAKQLQLDAELNYLKYQVQPHFLFNTLNNIYSLIDSSPSDAKTSVHSLSKMMRYLLHESLEKNVPLTKEIEFLKKYLELMQLRISTNVIIEHHFPIINQPLSIAPLILITFLENAFKHGIDAQEKSSIKIELNIDNTTLTYVIINTAFPDKNLHTRSGIGLKNLEKRLQRLYPDRYQLETKEEQHMFISKLTLSLS